jgi:hypothetical protein
MSREGRPGRRGLDRLRSKCSRHHEFYAGSGMSGGFSDWEIAATSAGADIVDNAGNRV